MRRRAVAGAVDLVASPLAVLLALLLALLLAACGGGSGAPPPPSTRDLGLSGVLVEQRADVELDRVEVELGVAPGSPTLHVHRVELSAPGFPAARGVSDPLLLAPGVPVDTPVVYGRPRCSAALARQSAAARLFLEGTAAPVVVRLADEDGSLARAHRRACTARQVARALPLAWDRTWTTVGAGADLKARGVLHLGPVPAGRTVAVESVSATPLFTYAPQEPGALPAVLLAGQSLDLPLLLTPARCDAHALADDKRGFAPQLSVRLGGAAPVLAYAWVARADREVATDAYSTACGLR